MKKILLIIACLLTIIPSVASAKSYNFNYYCDSKKDMGDGTFYMTCHILATTDFDVNHFEGELILKNVKLESIIDYPSLVLDFNSGIKCQSFYKQELAKKR